jgi:hypothetical protein
MIKIYCPQQGFEPPIVQRSPTLTALLRRDEIKNTHTSVYAHHDVKDDHLKDLGVYSIILKWISKKQNGGDSSGFIWLTKATSKGVMSLMWA